MLHELVIRFAAKKDAAEIAELEKKSFSQPWSEADILHDIEFNELVYVVVAEADSQIVGYMNVQIIRDECEIRRICVLPEQRKLRVGTILLRSLIQMAEMKGVQVILLDVREENEPALRLYKKNGFVQNGLRKNYYGPGQDAILMIRIGDPEDVNPDTQA